MTAIRVNDNEGGVSRDFAPESPDFRPSLVRALSNAGISVIYQGLDLRILWWQNIPQAWSIGDPTIATDHDLFPPAVANRVIDAKKRVILTLRPERLDISVPFFDSAKCFDLWIDAETDFEGRLRGLTTTAVETTDQKRREKTLTALLREVSHRSKNLLSIIQSIATQTGRYSGTIDSFMIRFRGRLQSIASSQDLVTSSNWRGADLRELSVGQLARYTPNPDVAIRFEGEIPWLNPNAALHIGLALHELAVNSVSCGALSRPDGVITISTEFIEHPGGGVSLSLMWSERIESTKQDAAMRDQSFGSVALERVVPASMNGSAKLTLADGRLDYTLLIPQGQFELD